MPETAGPFEYHRCQTRSVEMIDTHMHKMIIATHNTHTLLRPVPISFHTRDSRLLPTLVTEPLLTYLTGSSPILAGPFTTSPLQVNLDPWIGQSHEFSSEFHATIPFK